MSKHIWKQKTFSLRTARRACYAVELAWKSGLMEWEHIARWVGYLMETILQKGYCKQEMRVTSKEPKAGVVSSGPHYGRDGTPRWDVFVSYDLASIACRALKSKHKYASGANRNNYLEAGVKLIALAGEYLFEIEADAPTAMILDKMKDTLDEQPGKWCELLGLTVKSGNCEDIRELKTAPKFSVPDYSSGKDYFGGDDQVEYRCPKCGDLGTYYTDDVADGPPFCEKRGCEHHTMVAV